MSNLFAKGSKLVVSLAMAAALLAGCGGGSSAGGGASAGLDVDPASLAFPLAEKATISGLTS